MGMDDEKRAAGRRKQDRRAAPDGDYDGPERRSGEDRRALKDRRQSLAKPAPDDR